MPWGLISPFAWLRNACSRFSLSKTRTKNNTILSLSFQLSLYREHLQARTCFKMESEMNVRHKYSRSIFIIWVLRFILGMMTWGWKEFGRTGTRTRWIGLCDLGIYCDLRFLDILKWFLWNDQNDFYDLVFAISDFHFFLYLSLISHDKANFVFANLKYHDFHFSQPVEYLPWAPDRPYDGGVKYNCMLVKVFSRHKILYRNYYMNQIFSA